MDIQKDVKKEQWEQPKLVTLSRAKLGESVLVGCTTQPMPDYPNGYPSSGNNG